MPKCQILTWSSCETITQNEIKIPVQEKQKDLYPKTLKQEKGKRVNFDILTLFWLENKLFAQLYIISTKKILNKNVWETSKTALGNNAENK